MFSAVSICSFFVVFHSHLNEMKRNNFFEAFGRSTSILMTRKSHFNTFTRVQNTFNSLKIFAFVIILFWKWHKNVLDDVRIIFLKGITYGMKKGKLSSKNVLKKKNKCHYLEKQMWLRNKHKQERMSVTMRCNPWFNDCNTLFVKETFLRPSSWNNNYHLRVETRT